jgi:hypothetical protein
MKKTSKKVATKKAVKKAKAIHSVYIGADHRDIEGAFEQMKEQLRKLGLFVYDVPSDQGSDQYSVIVSKKKYKTDKAAELATYEMTEKEYEEMFGNFDEE